jgi:hypothetical protein
VAELASTAMRLPAIGCRPGVRDVGPLNLQTVGSRPEARSELAADVTLRPVESRQRRERGTHTLGWGEGRLPRRLPTPNPSANPVDVRR